MGSVAGCSVAGRCQRKETLLTLVGHAIVGGKQIRIDQRQQRRLYKDSERLEHADTYPLSPVKKIFENELRSD